jgi:nucleoid-associated protein YgaU
MGSFEFRSEKFTPPPGEARTPAQIEAQAGSNSALKSAHQLFHSGAEAHALAQPAVVPGAHEPISPLIQMIMRLPGHIGIFNSFFEALQSLILPHLDFLPHLDPSILAAHAHQAAHSTLTGVVGHAHIDLGVLPADAHILQSLQLNSISLSPGQMHLHLSDLTRHSLEVSGTPELGKPIYEGTSSATNPNIQTDAPQSDGALAGPALSDHGTANHLAGAHRIFSHALFERPTSGMNNSLASSSSTTSTSQTNQLNSGSPGVQPANGTLNVGANPFAPQPIAAPAGASPFYGANQSALNAGFRMAAPAEQILTGNAPLGPSGAVSEQLGARHILSANDQGMETFRPTLGGDTSSAGITEQSGNASTNIQPAVEGLRAKELSLDGGSKTGHSSHFRSVSGDTNTNGQSHLAQVRKPLSNVKDQIAHQTTKASSHIHGSASPHKIAALPRHANHSFLPKESRLASDQPAVSAGSDQPNSYTIRSGDCLWNIAKNQLGDATKWQEIYKLNVDKLGSNPDLIYPGTSIQLPNASQDLASHGMNAGKYVVRAGDNLWDISKHYLGGGEKWGQLYHLNSDVIGANPRLILPGQELTLPGSDMVASNSAAPVSAIAGTQAPIDNHMAQSLVSPQTTAATPQAPDAETAGAAAQPAAGDAPGAVSGANLGGISVLPEHVLSGPGGAQAATLAPQTPQNDPSVVSPSLAPDLSSFLGTAKR